MSGTMSGVLDSTLLTVEECCGEEEFLRGEEVTIETLEKEIFTSYQELGDRFSEEFNWDREDDEDI